jgi:1-deoxy-D-xylulose-5-phosphate synthase
VAAIYSTFLQRAYDSIIHDVAIQNLPVIFAMDRAGLVGNDGPTHMGLYDIAYLLAVPNMTVTAPKDGAEMLALLRLGVEHKTGPFSLRYPRDNVPANVPALSEIPPIEYGTWEVLRRGRGVAVLATGTMVLPALEAANQLAADGIDATVVNCRFIKPMDERVLTWVAAHHDAIVSVEEGTVVNGFGAALAAHLEAGRANHPDLSIDILGVPDRIIDHADRAQQLSEVGLDVAGIAERVRAAARRSHLSPVRETA